MPLRTVEQYMEGLRDSREVYVKGQRVADVTQHPDLAICIGHGANAYSLAHEPALRETFTFEQAGDVRNRHFEPLTSPDALRRRSILIEEHTRQARSTLNLTKAVGTDALAALHATSVAVDREHGTEYGARVAAFRERCASGDLSLVLAQTDVKGDRSLAPHQQPDPDMYVHIVERRSDGIVVRGAKAHTTMTPAADELIVLPTRAMSEADADYAVAFAIPVATPGLRLICGPLPDHRRSELEAPVSGVNIEMETLTVFDDVFVPWERVFLAGEFRHAAALATTFATFHRFTAISYKLPFAELALGCAVAMAELNGTAKAGHVREKIGKLVHYQEILRACIHGAWAEALPAEGGLFLPNPVYTNTAKFHFASQFHDVVRILQDIAGGMMITAPGAADLASPETGPWVRKYLQGAAGTDAETRLRLLHLIRDLTASDFGGYNLVVTLHGEGSLQAQLLQTLRDTDLTAPLAAVERIIGPLPAIAATSPSALPVLR